MSTLDARLMAGSPLAGHRLPGRGCDASAHMKFGSVYPGRSLYLISFLLFFLSSGALASGPSPKGRPSASPRARELAPILPASAAPQGASPEFYQGGYTAPTGNVQWILQQQPNGFAMLVPVLAGVDLAFWEIKRAYAELAYLTDAVPQHQLVGDWIVLHHGTLLCAFILLSAH